MGATLPNNNAPDRGSADRARAALALVHAEMILEVSAAVDPIDAGAVVAQAGA